jgi:pimeloyl-ACP methyl ester carboxylesterase
MNFLFVTGNSMAASTFEPLKAALSTHTVQIVELPGNGGGPRSTTPDQDYTLAGELAYLVDYITSKNLTDLVVIGHSYGGHIATQALPKIGDRLRYLVTTGSPPLTQPGSPDAFIVSAVLGLAFQEHLSSDECLQMATAMSTHNAHLVADAIAHADNAFRRVTANELALQAWQDEMILLSAAPCPTAFILGKDDGFVNADYVQTCADTLKRPCVLLDSASHIPMLDDTEAYLEALKTIGVL